MLPPLSEHALLPYRKGQYNADFYYVGGAMANTFPMMSQYQYNPMMTQYNPMMNQYNPMMNQYKSMMNQ